MHYSYTDERTVKALSVNGGENMYRRRRRSARRQPVPEPTVERLLRLPVVDLFRMAEGKLRPERMIVVSQQKKRHAWDWQAVPIIAIRRQPYYNML